jgi:hypothetical protein
LVKVKSDLRPLRSAAIIKRPNVLPDDGANRQNGPALESHRLGVIIDIGPRQLGSTAAGASQKAKRPPCGERSLNH